MKKICFLPFKIPNELSKATTGPGAEVDISVMNVTEKVNNTLL
jgi:hypothetical protein